MLFSYQEALEQAPLATHTKQFLTAALRTKTPPGLVLTPEALASFSDGVVGLEQLVNSVSDQASVSRVDHELKRRLLTGRVPEDVTSALVEAREILCLDDDLQVTNQPLVAVLSSDKQFSKQQVIINILGKKALADAVRSLWARLYTFPYPESTPQASIVLYRMPSLRATAHVQLSDEQALVRAVHGWGLLVGTQEVADSYVLKTSGALVDKEVQVQDSMVYRNSRTGEVVQTRPRDASGQKITDDEARTAVLLAKKAGVSEAVVGFGDEQVLLLDVSVQLENAPVARSSEQEARIQEETQEQQQEPEITPEPTEEVIEPVVKTPQEESFEQEPEPEVVIVDMEEQAEAEPEQAPQPTFEPEVKQAPVQEEAKEQQQQKPEPTPASEEVDEELSADALYAQSKQSAQQVLVSALASIESSLREWLAARGGVSQAKFTSLVEQVATQRQVPYKNRILTLYEMSQQDSFSEPSAEAVRFGLETLDRFRREF